MGGNVCNEEGWITQQYSALTIAKNKIAVFSKLLKVDRGQ
jgi:hypothetical protein